MTKLTLHYLGAFQATLDGITLAHFHSVKVQALLAYLALEANHPHTRETLMALLWPDDAPQSAQQSLRQALYVLRRMLGDTDDSAREPFLLVTRQTVQINPASQVTSDVTAFLQQVQQGHLAKAVALYPSDLLLGTTTDSAPFEEWLRTIREYLHNLALDALRQLTQQQIGNADYAQAITYARRQLFLEPWREEAHRQVMLALALSGERSAALAQYESCRRVLAEELGIEPGEETTSLYEQIRAGKLQRAVFTPHLPSHVAEPPACRHNLPSQPTPFIGRKTDLEQIAVRLQDTTCRLLTIVGPGGMGKTRLAIQAAQRLVETSFGDGIFFVALAGVASPDLLVSTIATALDFTFYGSGEPPQQLLAYLQKRSLLLVLDNCEHLLDGIDLISELIGAAPEVKVLATSREPLNLREEWLHPLSAMSFPINETTTAALNSYTAVQLFAQCARQMKPGFDLAAEAVDVVRICRLVEGLPLAIELAATWLKFYSCAQIVDEIRRSLDFLTTNVRNIPVRHRSMRAVFEHSWALLTSQEQKVFVRLAVFHGGFQLEAAHQVADATRPLLLALGEKSLVQLTPEGRFQLHELLKQFVKEKLLAQPEELSDRQKRHSHFYLTFLQQQEAPLKGWEQLTALNTIEGEIENIRNAWQWALTHQDIESLICTVDALYVFYFVRARFKEGKRAFEQAATAFAMCEPAGQRGILWGKLLTYQALMTSWFNWAIGGTATDEQSEPLFQQSISILQMLDAAEECGYAFGAFGEMYRSRGQFDQMQVYNQKALHCAEAKGDPWQIGQALYLLGFGYFWIGEYGAAIEYLQRGVSIGEAGGGGATLSNTLNVLSRAYRALGDYKRAQQAGQAALAIRTTIGDRPGMAWSQQVLGDLYWRIGDYETAQRYSQASLDLFADIGLVRLQAVALNNLGNIACSRDQLVEANGYFQRALLVYAKSDPAGIDFCVAETMVGLAAVCLKKAQVDVGVKLLIHVLNNSKAWRETREWAKRILATLPAERAMQVEMTIDAQNLMRLVTEVIMEAQPAST